MRRTSYLATFVLLLALMPASAQMRGSGHGSFGGHGGGFAGHGSFGGHMGGGHVFGGLPSGRGFSGSRFQSRGFSHGPSFHQPNFSRGDRFRGDRFRGDRFRGDRFRHRRFRDFDFDDFGRCFGCVWGGWPWWYAGYYDPYWYWDSHSSYDEEREHELQLAQQMNAQSLEEQRMRRQEDQDLYARSDPAPQTREADTSEAPEPATVLVFRDQHKLEVQNYAIVGQMLWNFAPQRTQKIPLAELDLAATAKANDERGVDFRMPGPGEGQ